jgi:superfamily II DNA or RNA helicase
VNLRPYQIDAVNAVLSGVAAGERSGLLSMATGTGKSVVMAEIAEQFIERHRKPVLIIAHRERLIRQLRDTCERHGHRVAVEMADQKAHDYDADVIVASTASLCRETRRNRYNPDRFGMVAVDEGHHSGAGSYEKILNHFGGAYHLGVTATPDRADGKKLPFDKIVYEYRLTTAIKEKYLCPIMAELVPIRIDMSKVKVTMGDFQDKSIDAALLPYLHRIADEIVRRKEKHLIFLPLIKTSVYMAKLLNDRGLKTAHLDGTSDDVDDIIKRYEAGEFDCLTNAMLFTEGTDIPCVSCITNLRITRSRSTYSQIVGRGTRLHPNKDRLLLLDFLFHSRRHRICTPASLVTDDTGRGIQISETMDRKRRAGVSVNIMEEADRIAEQVDRNPSLVKEFRQHEHKKRELIDPLTLDKYKIDGYVEREKWQSLPITETQLEWLKKQGIQHEGMTRGMAHYLYDKIHGGNIPTPAQERMLRSHGKWVDGMSKQQAGDEITRIIGKYK